MAKLTAKLTAKVTESQADRSQVSSLIRQLRQLLGLTQEQFASHMGVTLPTINRWENDRAKPSPLALLRIQTMLVELSQSAIEVQQVGAQALLSRHFPSK